jgi:hypothetical protein
LSAGAVAWSVLSNRSEAGRVEDPEAWVVLGELPPLPDRLTRCSDTDDAASANAARIGVADNRAVLVVDGLDDFDGRVRLGFNGDSAIVNTKPGGDGDDVVVVASLDSGSRSLDVNAEVKGESSESALSAGFNPDSGQLRVGVPTDTLTAVDEAFTWAVEITGSSESVCTAGEGFKP